MIIFFSLGGGTFIAAFVLMVISAATKEISYGVYSFIGENTILIIASAILISGLMAVVAAKLWGSKKAILPLFLMIGQVMAFLIQGLYYVSSDPYDSSFLIIWTVVIYIVASIFDAFVMLAIAGLTYDKQRVIPLYLAGVVGFIFNYVFW